MIDMPSEKILIKNDAGEQVEATAPVIISASRSTDIPAFYCDWFFHRLKVGYSAWTNPFNGVKMYVNILSLLVSAITKHNYYSLIYISAILA